MRQEILLLVCVCLLSVLAQEPARIGPDGKPLLNRPVLEKCQKRISHMKWQGHNYFMSWREPWHKFEDWDWFNGRNFCRDRCMDLVSFDTPGEYRLIAAIMRKDNVSSIYTSGRKCNFKGKGCDADHLQPININGWFWAGASNKRIPATNQRSNDAYWSYRGETEAPQPDNHEGLREGPINTEFDIGVTIEGLQEFHDEACLAVLNQQFRDGIAWHDVACHYRSVIVCEDSDQLLNLVESQNTGVDVANSVEVNDKLLEPESINVNEVEPLLHVVPKPPSPPPRRPGRPGLPPLRPNRPPRRPNQPPRRPGFLGQLRGRFPFLF